MPFFSSVSVNLPSGWGRGRTPRGGGGTPYNGLYRKAPPERGTFLRIWVYEGVGISLVEVYERVGKSVIPVCKRPKRVNDAFYRCEIAGKNVLVL